MATQAESQLLETLKCAVCGAEITCPQPPRAGNPLVWRDTDGWYGDVSYNHSPLLPRSSDDCPD